MCAQRRFDDSSIFQLQDADCYSTHNLSTQTFRENRVAPEVDVLNQTKDNLDQFANIVLTKNKKSFHKNQITK